MTDPTPAPPYREIEATNWPDLVAAFKHPSLRVFRGQREADWNLEPSLYRSARGISFDAAESLVVRHAERQVFRYLSDSQIPKDRLEWLSLIQHYGGPTRLLDFTRSPYVALFFALENASREDGSCAVWAIDRVWCQEKAAIACGATKIDFESLTIMQLGAQLDDVFKTLVGSNTFTGVLPIEPRRLHERLVLQQGEFLCPLNLKKSFIDNLTQSDMTGAQGGMVLKIRIRNQLRPFVLERLRDMNISRATLFPGLEGFVQSLGHLVVGENEDEIRRRSLLSALDSFTGPIAEAVHQMGTYESLRSGPAPGDDAASEPKDPSLVGTILGTQKGTDKPPDL